MIVLGDFFFTSFFVVVFSPLFFTLIISLITRFTLYTAEEDISLYTSESKGNRVLFMGRCREERGVGGGVWEGRSD